MSEFDAIISANENLKLKARQLVEFKVRKTELSLTEISKLCNINYADLNMWIHGKKVWSLKKMKRIYDTIRAG